MPFWLKFALIFALIITIIYVTGNLVENLLNIESDMGTPTQWVFLFFGAFPLILFFNAIRLDPSTTIPWYVAGVLYYFLVGSLLGLLIQFIKDKIKNKQKI